jgi:UDP-N-acetylmuramoyl-tripeptide--D-alanyl-D-alanine ligase
MGCDVAEAAHALGEFMAPKGRGEQATLQAADGAYLLLDESYNANPASVRAALDVLGATPVQDGGRRIAVLGDMLELGPQGADLHRGLAPTVVANDVDLVFGAGPLTRTLFDALPAQRQGLWTSTAAELAERLPERLRAGDVVMIKGSNGSRMGDVVAALQRLSARADAPEVPSC